MTGALVACNCLQLRAWLQRTMQQPLANDAGLAHRGRSDLQVASCSLRQQHHALVPWLFIALHALLHDGAIQGHRQTNQVVTHASDTRYLISKFLVSCLRGLSMDARCPDCVCVPLRAVICLAAQQCKVPAATWPLTCLSALIKSDSDWAALNASTTVMLCQVQPPHGPFCCCRQLRHCARQALM